MNENLRICTDFTLLVLEDILAGDSRERFLEAIKNEEPQAVRDFIIEHIEENAPLWAENSG